MPMFRTTARACALALVVFFCLPTSAAVGPRLNLAIQRGYLPGLPVLVRAERLDARGELDKASWDSEASVAVEPAGISLSTNHIWLRHGLGSAFITIPDASPNARHKFYRARLAP